MSAIWFLLVALVFSAVGSTVLVLRGRRPNTVEWSVEEFRREMRALAPHRVDDDRER